MHTLAHPPLTAQPIAPRRITPTQLARRVGVHPSTIRRYIAEGLIPDHLVLRVGPRLLTLDPSAQTAITRPLD